MRLKQIKKCVIVNKVLIDDNILIFYVIITDYSYS